MRIRINGNVCTSPDEVRMCASPKAARFIEEYFADGDTIVAHTSGSTGTPKEIHLRKSDMRASQPSRSYICASRPTTLREK